MPAWNKQGQSVDHPEPWGRNGSFSTLRVFPGRLLPFRRDYLDRLLESAEILGLRWIPPMSLLEERLADFLPSLPSRFEGLLRICLFEDCLGFSHRASPPSSEPVKGRLLVHRRPEPRAKSTLDKDLYARLSELDRVKEDWIIIDPEIRDLRESATCNLVFAKGETLTIPESGVLRGIVLNQLLPRLEEHFSIIRSRPAKQEVTDYEEILLCGTGRGVSPLRSIPELGWKSTSGSTFKLIRSIYEDLITAENA